METARSIEHRQQARLRRLVDALEARGQQVFAANILFVAGRYVARAGVQALGGLPILNCEAGV